MYAKNKRTRLYGKHKIFMKEFLQDIIKIFIGNVFMSFAYAKWMVPHHVINGGVTSLSLVLSKLIHLPLLYITNGLTLLLLLLCWLFLGKVSFFKSIFSSVFYMVLFSIFYEWQLPCTINLVVDLAGSVAFISFGYYCCISTGASTVGVDVIALIIHKRKPQFSSARLIRWMNCAVLLLGFFVYGIQAVLLGLLFTFLYSFLLEKMLERKRAAER